jgi:uncharacterized phage protein (TIGR02218 family)
MPRTIGGSLVTHLASETPTLAVCTKIERLDTTVLGFTSHDKSLTVDGVDYEAGSAVDSTALRNAVGTGVDNLEIMGLLDSAAIDEADLKAGLYDGASVTIFLVNWADVTMGTVVLLKGYIGQVTYMDGHYVAEIRSLMQRLQQSIGELTSPTCRVKELGDARCKLNLASFTFAGKVVAASPAPSRRQFTFASTAQSSDYFHYGTVEFTSGLNTGIVREIKRHTLVSGAALIELQEPMPFNVAAADVATLIAGCDRRFTTCQTKFSNEINFRGEPHLPGTDSYIKRGARA